MLIRFLFSGAGLWKRLKLANLLAFSLYQIIGLNLKSEDNSRWKLQLPQNCRGQKQSNAMNQASIQLAIRFELQLARANSPQKQVPHVIYSE